jgi:hypothetical protein
MDELGIAGDSTVFQGVTPGDVWEQVAAYLKKNRGIDLPSVDDALGGGKPGIIPPRFDNAIPGQQSPVVAGTVDPGAESEDRVGVNLIVTRLLEKLRMGKEGRGGETVPPGGNESLVP